MSEVKFYSASEHENEIAATTKVDYLFNAFTGKVDPKTLSKICQELNKYGTEAILDIGRYPVVFKANRKNDDTLRANAFPNTLTAPSTGENGSVMYKVTGIRLVKTGLSVSL